MFEFKIVISCSLSWGDASLKLFSSSSIFGSFYITVFKERNTLPRKAILPKLIDPHHPLLFYALTPRFSSFLGGRGTRTTAENQFTELDWYSRIDPDDSYNQRMQEGDS